MQVLVACTKRLLLLDTTTRRFEVVEDHREDYYGISWFKDSQNLYFTHTGPKDVLRSETDYLASERGWISSGPASSSHFLATPHQICCDEDLILATNTGRNCLSLIRRQDFFYINHWLEAQHWDHDPMGKPVGSHFNSVFRHDDKLYIVAHNFALGSYLLVLAWPSLKPIERVTLSALGAHNFWIDDAGGSYVCDSMRTTVLNTQTQKVVWQADRANILTRGAAGCGSTLLIGASVLARRQDRKSTDGGVFVLDTATWTKRDFIELPCVGQVCEIRLLDEPDYCHHRLPFRGSVAIDPQAGARYRTALAQLAELEENIAVRIPGWNLQYGDVVRADPAAVEFIPGTFGILTANCGEFKNVRIRGDVSIPATAEPQSAGFIVRFRGPEDANMYVGLLYRDGTFLRADIWRHSDGNWVTLQSTPVAFTELAVTMELLVRDNSLTFSVSGAATLSIIDEKLDAPGLVGVRGTAGSFSNIVVEPL